MVEKLRRFLSGAGSILLLYPASTSLLLRRPEFMNGSIQDRLASDWMRVGHHLQRAIDKSAGEQRHGQGE
jgi:hypothetical protein